MPEPASPLRDWEFILSHHLPHRYGRTFTLRARSSEIHVCARCAGQLAGVVSFSLLYLVQARSGAWLFLPTTQLWVAFAPAPAAIDWFTQSTAQRESTNWLRFVSGALLGFALSDMLLLLITAQVWLALAGLGLLGLYTLFVAAGLWRTGAWRRVLTEHFPGIELEGS